MLCSALSLCSYYFLFFASLVAASWYIVYRSGTCTVSPLLFGRIEYGMFTSFPFLFYLLCDNFIVPSKLCLFGKIQCFFFVMYDGRIFFSRFIHRDLSHMHIIMIYLYTTDMNEWKETPLHCKQSLTPLCTAFSFFLFFLFSSYIHWAHICLNTISTKA